jgi:hypothetical protein
VETLWTLENTFLAIKSENVIKKFFDHPFCMGSAHCAKVYLKGKFNLNRWAGNSKPEKLEQLNY